MLREDSYLDCWVREDFLEPLSALQWFFLEVIVKLERDDRDSLININYHRNI